MAKGRNTASTVVEECEKIDREIKDASIGVFKVFKTSVDATWKFGKSCPNRLLEQTRVQKLLKIFKGGVEKLERTNPAHKMECTIKREDWDAINEGTRTWEEDIVSQVRIWPTDIDTVLELEAGQHRFAALTQIHADPQQQWWWCNIYIYESPPSCSMSVADFQISLSPLWDVSGRINPFSRIWMPPQTH